MCKNYENVQLHACGENQYSIGYIFEQAPELFNMTHAMDGNNKCNTWMYNNKEIFFAS